MNRLLDTPISAYPDLLRRIMNNLPTFESLVLILPKKNSEFTRDEGAGGTFWVVQNEVEVDDEAWMKVRLTDDLKKRMKTTDMLPLTLTNVYC